MIHDKHKIILWYNIQAPIRAKAKYSIYTHNGNDSGRYTYSHHTARLHKSWSKKNYSLSPTNGSSWLPNLEVILSIYQIYLLINIRYVFLQSWPKDLLPASNSTLRRYGSLCLHSPCLQVPPASSATLFYTLLLIWVLSFLSSLNKTLAYLLAKLYDSRSEKKWCFFSLWTKMQNVIQ